MGSTIIKIFSGEHASEPPKTALAQILGEGAFFVSRGAFLGLAPPYENSCGRPCPCLMPLELLLPYLELSDTILS